MAIKGGSGFKAYRNNKTGIEYHLIGGAMTPVMQHGKWIPPWSKERVLAARDPHSSAWGAAAAPGYIANQNVLDPGMPRQEVTYTVADPTTGKMEERRPALPPQVARKLDEQKEIAKGTPANLYRETVADASPPAITPPNSPLQNANLIKLLYLLLVLYYMRMRG